jgi:hypothetical protein
MGPVHGLCVILCFVAPGLIVNRSKNLLVKAACPDVKNFRLTGRRGGLELCQNAPGQHHRGLCRFHLVALPTPSLYALAQYRTGSRLFVARLFSFVTSSFSHVTSDPGLMVSSNAGAPGSSFRPGGPPRRDRYHRGAIRAEAALGVAGRAGIPWNWAPPFGKSRSGKESQRAVPERAEVKPVGVAGEHLFVKL